MDWNLKKMWPAVAASLVAFTTVVNADNAQQNQTSQQNQNQSQSKTNQQPMVRNGEGPDMMITPNANLTNRFFVTGEALFWWAREGGLEFAINDPCYDSVGAIFGNARFENPKTKWSTGFRIGAGYVFKHDGWDLDASWTYFQSHAKTTRGGGECACDCSSIDCGCALSGCCPTVCSSSSSSSSSCGCPVSSSSCSSSSTSSSSTSSSSSSSGCSSSSTSCSDCCSTGCGDSFSSGSSPWCGPTIPLWSDIPTDGTNLTVGDAAAKWKVRLNMVDLDLGRAFMTSKHLALRPSIGVRGAWTNEKYKILYTDFDHVQQPVDATVNVFAQNIEMTNKTWGVGPKFGLDSRWNVRWGFSFYGNAAISLLYGNFSIHQRENISYDIDSTDIVSCNEICSQESEAYHIGQAVTDFALGLMWEHTFKSDWRLAFNLGWEQHLFFNRNQYWRITRPGGPDGFTNDFAHERGDLSFQGITLGGAIDF